MESLEWIVGLVALALPLIFKLGKRREPARPMVDAEEAEEILPPLPPRPAATELVKGSLDQRLARLVDEAEVASREAKVSRATVAFAPTLDGFVIRHARALRREIAGGGVITGDTGRAVKELELVLAQVQSFIGQRRNPGLLHRLGDADTLAAACYQPVIDFAGSRNLRLTSARPVVELWSYDLATWTGFIPTGLAPIFLPSDFFERAAWWPAIAHEIAHDFLAAVPALDMRLRGQLGLVDEAAGRRPLQVVAGGGLGLDELSRVFGGWFEEIFCDVFATLMIGPAYGVAMRQLFATPGEPVSMAVVALGPSGWLHDSHPPRLLRLMACARVLELVDQARAAGRLIEEWTAIHGGSLPDAFYFPVGGQYLGIDASVVIEIGNVIVDALCNEQLLALDGFQLRSVPGVDFGPVMSARVELAAAQLLRREVPGVADPRAIVAGAVLVADAHPAREAETLALARRAILAFGTTEAPADAYVAPVSGEAAVGETAIWRQRFLLQVILGPPRVRDGRRRSL